MSASKTRCRYIGSRGKNIMKTHLQLGLNRAENQDIFDPSGVFWVED